MSNVTVQEALKNALFTIRCYRTEITLDKKRQNDLIEVDLVISEIKASLAEIEKCEPVGEVVMVNEPEWMKPREGFKWYQTEFPLGTKFYTSPQPRDWAGLSDDDIRDVFRKFGWTANRVDFEDARAIEAKLKQLNTKG